MANRHLFPVATGNGIIARVHDTVFNTCTLAATDVNTIPATGNMQVLEYRVVDEISQKGIIGRTHYLKVLKAQVAASGKEHGMGSTHRLFAFRVAHIVAINTAFAFNATMVHVDTQYHGPRPFRVGGTIVVYRALSALIGRKVARGAQRLIGIQLLRSLQGGSRL